MGLRENPIVSIREGLALIPSDWKPLRKLRDPMEDVISVLEADDWDVTSRSLVDRATVGMWPLLSHHPFNPHGLLRPGRKRHGIADDALTLLLLYDGLAIADPLVEIREAARLGDDLRAIKLFKRMMFIYAELEPLFEAGVLAVEHARPSLKSGDRAAVLAHFGIDPGMTVFTNFEEIFAGYYAFSETGREQILRQCEELIVLLGLPPQRFSDPRVAHAAMRSTAQALLHLSWQLAVCTDDPEVDVVLLNPSEEVLFRELVNSSSLVDSDIAGATTHTEYVGMASLGDIPSFDGMQLTVDEAVTIRRDDSFELFRGHLRRALDDNRTAVARDRLERERAVKEFEARMNDAAKELAVGIRSSSLKRHARDRALPAGVAIVASAVAGGVTDPSNGVAVAVGAAVAATLTGVAETIGGWLSGRRGQEPRSIAVRYAAALGRPAGRL
ncbi:hypothetical protein [Microbacterium sp. SSM24]|uniref:hypothetical protein n=1 Tax=Microbacterium sp. SSM24 TaxID=2991714 RepID=UPI002226DEEE|nr:hypothetical protein [Microbacterium sp. SSM24]MCW3492033.1 hypothetical protein [Microbacterium sp. SSM24]